MGANDGSVSTASLLVGVAAADSSHANVLLARVAFWGALAMAATAVIGKLFGVAA